MTLQEVAEVLAGQLNCEMQAAGDLNTVPLQGKGYTVTVQPFFGGWQATVHLPDQAPVTFYAEAAEMLVSRIRAKLTGRDPNF